MTYPAANRVTPLFDESLEQAEFRLSGDALSAAVKQHGIALCRTSLGPKGFYKLATESSLGFMLSPFGDRQRVSKNNQLQTVTLGQSELDLHFEFGSSPMRPNLLWFYCHRPALAGSGGETVVADGADIFSSLCDETQATLRKRRIKYRNYLPKTAFDAMMSRNTLPGQMAPDVIAEMLSSHPDISVQYLDGERVLLEYSVSPVQSDGNRTYIGQNIFTDPYASPSDVGADSVFALETAWEDGTPISENLTQELKSAAHRVTREIHWQEGDFVVIDNNRYMHGRSAFDDPERFMLVLCSFSKDFNGLTLRG